MKKIITSIPVVAMFIIGCGGENAPLTPDTNHQEEPIMISENSTTNNVARDNTLHEVVKSFRNYQIKVLTDKTLDKDAISNDTFAVYGEVDGENTAALLKLNSNYPKGTKITVKVFDNQTNKLVGKSEPIVYDGGVVNFDVIEVD